MIRFLDGPAEGVRLELRAAPEALRVVIDHTGTWDALDQPGDEPRADETVFVYRRLALPAVIHVDFVLKGRCMSKTFASADYRFVPKDSGDDGCKPPLLDSVSREG